jgi:sugar/nucleoside kinase (ribokinase family)
MVYFQGTLGGLPNIEQDLKEILKIAKKLDAFRFLDVIMPSNGWDYLFQVMSEIDLLHCNLDEGKIFTGLEKPKDMLENLLDLGVKGVIITDGANGLIAGSKDYIIDMPAFDVTQIDPTGAGDALCAGIIHFVKSMKDSFYELSFFTEALLFGQASGAACVTGIGATTNVQPSNINKVLSFKEDILKKTIIDRR